MKTLKYFIIVLGTISCNSNEMINKEIDLSHSQELEVKESKYLIQEDEIDKEQSFELKCDTMKINGKRYIGCYNNQTNFFVINSKLDTIYKHQKWVNSVEFLDFNNDGMSDIIFEYMSNIPDVLDLAIFDNTKSSFELVEDFNSFPSPKKIDTTGYYYSYIRSGCADSNWNSDLFIIQNDKAIRKGNISGIGCEGTGKTGIFISKVSGKEIKLIKEILRDPGYYDDKFEFIKNYWNRNYSNFK